MVVSWVNNSDKFLPVPVTSTEILGGSSSPSRELAIPVYPPPLSTCLDLHGHSSQVTSPGNPSPALLKYESEASYWVAGPDACMQAMCLCVLWQWDRRCLVQGWWRPIRLSFVLYQESAAQNCHGCSCLVCTHFTLPVEATWTLGLYPVPMNNPFLLLLLLLLLCLLERDLAAKPRVRGEWGGTGYVTCNTCTYCTRTSRCCPTYLLTFADPWA